MFDIGALELLMIVIVAVIVIGPKDMPLAMRTAGRWIGKVRRVSAHFRTGIDAMVREAELEDMEKKWKARNEEIMREHQPQGDTQATQTGAEAALMHGPSPAKEAPANADAPAPAETPAEPAPKRD
jgi:sec-independent protein translocase protein TatB